MRRLHLLVPFFLFCACCGALSGTLQRARGWTQHNDPKGFALSHPNGWQITVSEQKAVFLQSPDGTAFVVIQPFIAGMPLSADQWIQRVPMNNPLFPQARLLKVGQLPGRNNEAIASMAFTQPNGAWQAGMIVSLHGQTGMLFIAAAKSEVYRQMIPTLVETLKSFHFTAAPAPGRSVPNNVLAGIQWSRFVDPGERSFSVEVPAGWQVEGGASRRSSTDVRRVMTLSSPDRRVIMFNNDPQLMLYTAPHPSIPIPEGQNYQGWNMARYRTGDQFLREYVPSKLSGICSNVQFQDLRPRPDIDAYLNNAVMQNGLGNFLQYSFGEAQFSCQCASGPMMGYYIAGIIRAQANPSLVNWTPDSLGGFVATPDQFPVAAEIFSHMVKTFQIDPNWAAGQSSLTMRTVQIQREANEQIAGMISSTYKYKNDVWDKTNRNFDNAIRGQVDLVAPDGTTYKGVNGSNYYHLENGTSKVWGTNTADPPSYSTEFTPLIQW